MASFGAVRSTRFPGVFNLLIALWRARCLAQFLINPSSSARVVWQLLPAESSSREAEET
jgi:hypothetical protein